MENNDTLKAEIKALRERLSRLSEASLRISDSLDLNTVLREVVAGTCALTGAGIGGITTRDESGRMLDFVTQGISPHERRQLLDLSRGAELWAYLKEVAEPLRSEDLSAHLASLGLPTHALMERSFLGMPVRHLDRPIGFLYILDKADAREFTDEDEEIMALFASQAGAAMANARRYLDEQQARADLEALIETSPVGVVVFDARSGMLLSVNRESRRMVGDLCKPGHSVEELMNVIRFYRADGREIAMEGYLLDWLLDEAEPVRAEEIVIEGPDGRRITTLINAVPIVSQQGEVTSVAVTMLDMSPMEALERERSEFMDMVHQELTAPLSSIKGCSATAVRSSAALSAAESEQFFRIIDQQADHMRRLISDLMDSAQIESGTLSLATEPAALSAMVAKARRMFVDDGGRHPVRIDLPDDLPRVRADQRRIVQVLANLLTNAARRSPDSAAISVEARHRSVYVEVSVVDGGPGIPTERLPHLFRKYARTGGEDRGLGASLGLAICKGLVEAHGGRIRAEPHRGTQGEDGGPGTRFTFTIPVVEDVRTEVTSTSTGKRSQSVRTQPDRNDDGRPLILVVDDDPLVLVYVRETLENAGYRTKLTGDPEQVKELVESHQPDLVLMDLVLPGTDGIELMTSLPGLSDRPVVFISVYGREETIARAMEVGAADYLVKPFSPMELVARIQSALRKHTGPPEPFRLGDLVIDYEERHVELKGKPLRLTATEYDLLRLLSTHAGRVVTYDRILGSVWKTRNPGDARLVRVFVKKLRYMLGDDAKRPKYIFTVPRVGYQMAGPGDLEGDEGTG